MDRDIQLTRLLARTAARAFFLVNAEPVERGRIEQPVYGAERAEITAERPVYQQGKQQQSGKDRGFPGEQPAERGSQRRIGGNQRDAREQRAGGAVVFAEPRLSLPDNIQQGQGQHDAKACKDDVFQIFEPAVAGQAAQLSPARQPKILLTNGFQDEEPYFIAMQNDSLHETLRRLPLANYKRLQWNGVHEWNFWDRSLVYAIDYFFAPGYAAKKLGDWRSGAVEAGCGA